MDLKDTEKKAIGKCLFWIIFITIKFPESQSTGIFWGNSTSPFGTRDIYVDSHDLLRNSRERKETLNCRRVRIIWVAPKVSEINSDYAGTSHTILPSHKDH